MILPITGSYRKNVIVYFCYNEKNSFVPLSWCMCQQLLPFNIINDSPCREFL